LPGNEQVTTVCDVLLHRRPKQLEIKCLCWAILIHPSTLPCSWTFDG
jgi:hypothetical protein